MHPEKLLRKPQIHFFSLLPWAAQTAQTEEFMFQIVAYRPTVYRTGVKKLFLEKEKIMDAEKMFTHTLPLVF